MHKCSVNRKCVRGTRFETLRNLVLALFWRYHFSLGCKSRVKALVYLGVYATITRFRL